MKRLCISFCIVLGAGAAHADAIFEYAGGDGACHGEFTRVAVQGLSMRIDGAPPGQDYSFVFDAAEKTGVTLDHRRKTFFEMELDDDAIEFTGDVMKSTSDMVDRKTEKMQADMARACADSAGRMNCGAVDAMRPAGANGATGIPQIDPKLMEQMMQQNMQHMNAEQRAQMEQAMKNLRTSGTPGFGGAPGRGPSATGRSPSAAKAMDGQERPSEAMDGRERPPLVEATGERREVGGLACTVERVTQDGQLLREDCRAPLEALGLDAGDLKRLQRAIGRMEKFAGTIRDNMRMVRGKLRDMTYPQDLVVERRCFEQGKPAGTVALRVRRESAPAAWFTTPADYARMDMGIGGR